MTRLSRPARAAWWTFGLAVLTFVYLPLLVVAVISVNADQTFAWPPSGFTLQWWSRAAAASGPREALLTSLEEQPNLGIRRSLRAQDLPDAARDYLRPRARPAYFPQAERPAAD